MAGALSKERWTSRRQTGGPRVRVLAARFQRLDSSFGTLGWMPRLPAGGAHKRLSGSKRRAGRLKERRENGLLAWTTPVFRTRIAGNAAILYSRNQGKGTLLDMRTGDGSAARGQCPKQWNPPKGDSKALTQALDCRRPMRVGNRNSSLGFAVPGLAGAALVAGAGLFMNSLHRFEARASEIP